MGESTQPGGGCAKAILPLEQVCTTAALVGEVFGLDLDHSVQPRLCMLKLIDYLLVCVDQFLVC